MADTDTTERTEGTDRDFDGSGTAENQGHGHPRDQQQRDDERGESLAEVTEEDRKNRSLQGPGG